MKWIKGSNPKKGEYIALGDSKAYLLRFHDDTISIKFWMGDRWLNLNNGGNSITHYMLIEEVKK